jgi:hypothetical protein
MSSQNKVYEIWEAEFDGTYADGRFLCIVMHSQVIGRRSRMAMLERLIQHMLRHDGVWFATHPAIAQAWRTAHPTRHERPCRRRRSLVTCRIQLRG